jgi:ArsR family transcriptional regulator
MIEAAKERLGRYENVRAESADVHEMPFRAASFDAVLLFHTLTYAAKPARALEECARVLRPGGRVVILTLDAHDQRELTAPYGECHPGFAPRALKSLLARAGFAITSCEIACREAKKPHFQVVLSIARRSERAKPAPSKRTKGG